MKPILEKSMKKQKPTNTIISEILNKLTQLSEELFAKRSITQLVPKNTIY